MTDDLAARLRHEGDDEAVEALRFQEASIRRLERELATAEARVRELEAELATMEARAVAADLAVVKAAKVATTEAYERAAEVADCHADECDAASFASTVAEQVSALRSKEQAAHEIATAIRKLAQEVKHEAD